MKQALDLMKVKNFIKDPASVKYIKWDWDAGHAYSYIDHPVASIDDMTCEVLLDNWLYENESDQPPCAIHVDHSTQKVSSSCGCHDDLSYSEGLVVVQELAQWCKDNNREHSIPYVISTTE